jgi:GxxExxY protein
MSTREPETDHEQTPRTTSADESRRQRDPQTYAIIGAAIAVHRGLRSGFLERVYHEALALELADRGIAFAANAAINVQYKGRVLSCFYRADLICFPLGNPVLVELKARERLTGTDRAQVLHYLHATGIKRALLFNFGGLELDYERIVLGWER